LSPEHVPERVTFGPSLPAITSIGFNEY